MFKCYNVLSSCCAPIKCARKTKPCVSTSPHLHTYIERHMCPVKHIYAVFTVYVLVNDPSQLIYSRHKDISDLFDLCNVLCHKRRFLSCTKLPSNYFTAFFRNKAANYWPTSTTFAKLLQDIPTVCSNATIFLSSFALKLCCCNKNQRNGKVIVDYKK